MSKSNTLQQQILTKLKIESLNPMQQEAELAILNSQNVVLLSPTGSGKTLAFLLPILSLIDSSATAIQALVLVPSRELAIQIEQVIRAMGTGNKTNAFYGGRPFSKDKIELQHPPSILVGTPGRIADHLRRQSFSVDAIKMLVLDEFDKSLEVGFEKEMSEIISLLPNIEKRVLTSATQGIEIPRFVGLKDQLVIDYLDTISSQLEIKKVISPSKNKLQTLIDLLSHIGAKPGIIFCNYKDSIKYVSDFLVKHNIPHGCFYGGLDQIERERALIKFRNGTHQIIVATDLAARGLDISKLNYIIHYQLPLKPQEFIHRNGRTARMNSQGTAYVLQWEEDIPPEFITTQTILKLVTQPIANNKTWETLFISGGRKDKISKGDIAGLFIKQGGLNKDELGVIELKQDCAFVAVAAAKASQVIEKTNNTKLKKKKVRITVV